MIDSTRFLAGVVGLLLGLFAQGVWCLHDPGSPYVAKALALGLVAVALLGWALYPFVPRGLAREMLSAIGEALHDQFGLNLCFRCLLGHDWEINHCFPNCRRCDALGDPVHTWEGCRCKACDEVRDEQHEWDDCTCKLCGRTRHEWREGLCTRCGKRCDHAEKTFFWNLVESGRTMRAAKISLCEICGSRLAVLCESTPRDLPARRRAKPSRNATPPPSDMASDPLWQELRNCWVTIAHANFPQSLESQEINSQLYKRHKGVHHQERPAPLLFAHEEALKALVGLKQLAPNVAAGIRYALEEAIVYRAPTSTTYAMCYSVRRLPKPEWHLWLLDDARLLLRVAERGRHDPAAALEVRISMAHDIAIARHQAFHTWAPAVYVAAPPDITAAEILVALLSHKPQSGTINFSRTPRSPI